MSLLGDGDDATQGSSHDESPAITDEEETDVTEKIEEGKAIEVKCGPLRAKMHVELFVCPGIHQQCIELNGDMISPKEFTVRANKDKQKDWKGSIRIGKSNLRTLMELRKFDFFNHMHYCSAKCQSRNYITPKSERINTDGSEREHRRSSVKSNIEHFMAIHGSQLQHHASPTSPFTVINQEPPGQLSQLVQMSTAVNNNNQCALIPLRSSHLSVPSASDELVDVDDSMLKIRPSSEHIGRMMHSDATQFWSHMQQIGLLDELVDRIVHEVDTVRNETRVHNITPRVCGTLSRLCSALDMHDIVAARVRARRPSMDLSDISITDLVQHEERKRRAEEPAMPIPHRGFPQSNVGPELKRPRTQYAPVMQSPLIDALIKVQTTYQLHQSAPFSNMDFLLKFASQPPAMPVEASAVAAPFNSQLTDALLKMQ